MKNEEVTIPLNKKTLGIITEYARSLDSKAREDLLERIKIADIKATIADYQAKIAELNAELAEESQKNG